MSEIINQERFEAWLFSQPDERTLEYGSCYHCVVGTFIRETTSFWPNVGGLTVTIWSGGDSFFTSHNNEYDGPLPQFIIDLLRERRAQDILKLGDVKQWYIKLFGDPNANTMGITTHSATTITSAN